MNTEILVVAAILLPMLIALAFIRRRRPAEAGVAVAEPVQAEPYRPQPYRWYRTTGGRFSWTHERRDGKLERGPFFTRNAAYGVMNKAPLIRWSLAGGMSSAEAIQGIRDVMCYYLVEDPRLGDGVTAREIDRALRRALVLLTDDLLHFRTMKGEPDPFLAPFRATSRLREEANDDGSWLVAADLLGDAPPTIDEWIGRVVDLLQAVGG